MKTDKQKQDATPPPDAPPVSGSKRRKRRRRNRKKRKADKDENSEMHVDGEGLSTARVSGTASSGGQSLLPRTVSSAGQSAAAAELSSSSGAAAAAPGPVEDTLVGRVMKIVSAEGLRIVTGTRCRVLATGSPAGMLSVQLEHSDSVIQIKRSFLQDCLFASEFIGPNTTLLEVPSIFAGPGRPTESR